MNHFNLNQQTGYFQNKGVNIMAFDDIYPEGHQSGISIIMHGSRLATNGDIRFEQTPGQWQPVPKQVKREVGADAVTTTLRYPDESRHLKGFNPMIYPDFKFEYTVTAKARGQSVIITATLDRPIPDRYIGKLCFNLELFPGKLVGQPWIMDNNAGIFPMQPNGPVLTQASNYVHIKAMEHLAGNGKSYNPFIADDIITAPYATGKRFTLCPNDPYSKFTIESKGPELKLYDGRMNHNNGWFVISSEFPANESTLTWVITPNVVESWLYTPVIQTSQVGYHPHQRKTAVVELDKNDTRREEMILYKISEEGPQQVLSAKGQEWGHFLRYNYLKLDFTNIMDEGLYNLTYGTQESSIFRIAKDIYDRGCWQPVLEYFLPIQMCHMRVSEKYRVWHGLCHDDDARMAPVNYNHVDGFIQDASTLTTYQPGDVVPGLNIGGWHDAGDHDIRVESQSKECYILSLAYEHFNIDYDATTIDQQAKIVEIHQPDGKNDILQQIEHGVLSVVAGYQALGRLYRGIIENNLRQYVHLGDTAVITDNIKGNEDDRWVFTEDNPTRELTVAAHLAGVSRALKGFNDELSSQALEISKELFQITNGDGNEVLLAKIHAATELFLSTSGQGYKDFLLNQAQFIADNIDTCGWFIGRTEKALSDSSFTKTIRTALPTLKNQLNQQAAETPYDIPYQPRIWGAGWAIQKLGVECYFLHKSYPDIFEPEMIFSALNFVLGCHPGSNTVSFASGVGTKSATVGYGLNRADWSYIPGGVISGTALIRPDFPELLTFPYLWQQVEYVMGGGSSNYMFLVLAVQALLKASPPLDLSRNTE